MKPEAPLDCTCLVFNHMLTASPCLMCLLPVDHAQKLTFCSCPMSVIHSVMRRPLFAASSTLLTTSTAAAAVPACMAGAHAWTWSKEMQKAGRLQLCTCDRHGNSGRDAITGTQVPEGYGHKVAG